MRLVTVATAAPAAKTQVTGWNPTARSETMAATASTICAQPSRIRSQPHINLWRASSFTLILALFVVDDLDGAGGVVNHIVGDAPFEQPPQTGVVARADDDEIG